MEENDDAVLRVSCDRAGVRHADLRPGVPWPLGRDPQFSASHTWSAEAFRAGQHYWEVAVGEKPHWSLGVEAEPRGKAEIVGRLNGRFGKHRFKTRREVPLDLAVRPRVIGTYLDCERRRVAFYDADAVKLLASAEYATDKPLFAYFDPGFYLRGENADALTVRWY